MILSEDFSSWFCQYGNLIPMSWPESRSKQDMELAREAWEGGVLSRNSEIDDWKSDSRRMEQELNHQDLEIERLQAILTKHNIPYEE